MEGSTTATAPTGDKAALFIVDVQNDFCEPSGSLAVKGSLEIIPLINKLRENPKFDYIVTSRDWHPQNHCSFASNNGKPLFSLHVIPETGREQVMWPDHCVQGSEGAEFHKDLVRADTDINVLKGQLQWVETYSGFGSVDLGEDLGLVDKLKNLGVRDVYCCGLATDYCVGSTAVDAAKYGFNTFLIEDAARAVAEITEQGMKTKCDAAGVKWVKSTDLGN